jgi:hypothetical protein
MFLVNPRGCSTDKFGMSVIEARRFVAFFCLFALRRHVRVPIWSSVSRFCVERLRDLLDHDRSRLPCVVMIHAIAVDARQRGWMDFGR